MICWAAHWTTAIVMEMEMMMMMMMMMVTMRYRVMTLMKKWSSPMMTMMVVMMTALLLIGPGECSTSRPALATAPPCPHPATAAVISPGFQFNSHSCMQL